MTEQPADPMTQLATDAASQHEMFLAYVDAGFTEAQALQILIGILSAHITGSAS